MSDVVLTGVVKRYAPEVTAVRGLDLHVEGGEFVALVGPSGCGKTTTLRMVAGLEEITEGELTIGGERMNDVAPRDRGIAMVFQSYALYPHMSVYENMAFGLRLRRLPKAEIDRRVRDAAGILGLGELLKRKPRALSGGQRQRVAMGRAIVREPRVFLFDEPLSNLDAKLRHEMRLEIARLHARSQATTLYVTHDQVEAMTLADRIAIMERGVLQQYGSPLDVYQRPRNRFVAGFIGSPSMNFLPGKIVGGEGGLRFVGTGFSVAIPAAGDGEPIEIGIRPQAFSIDPDHGQLEAAVELVEPLGPETYIHFHWGEHQVTARVSSELEVHRGDLLRLSIEPRHVHLFSADGRTL